MYQRDYFSVKSYMGLYSIVNEKTGVSGHPLPKAIHFQDSEAETLMHTA